MNVLHELIKSFSPGISGYLYMWVLALLGVLAVALIIERWIDIKRRTNLNAESFIGRISALIMEKKFDEAYSLCFSAGKRALPRIIGAGVKRAGEHPELLLAAMEEESLHVIPIMEKRINYIITLGNISTLLGLMGTIYGLIISFAAVARPDVDPVLKSSLLASGISAAMNTTLLGLMISIPCVLIYSILRSKTDVAIQEIDRYATAILKVLVPLEPVKKGYRVTARRIKEEVDTDPNIAPMMNLMVILIPLLLSSAEFVKIGAIELKLPESSQGGGGGSGPSDEINNAKLELGIVITKKGFDLYHFFKAPVPANTQEPDSGKAKTAEIPLKDGKYDFNALNAALAEVKKKALFEIIRAAKPSVPVESTLMQLYTFFMKNDVSGIEGFKDHEDVKIVAEEQIRYETVVAVMDAARGTTTPFGNVTLFPNVSLAGGIIY